MSAVDSGWLIVRISRTTVSYGPYGVEFAKAENGDQETGCASGESGAWVRADDLVAGLYSFVMPSDYACRLCLTTSEFKGEHATQPDENNKTCYYEGKAREPE